MGTRRTRTASSLRRRFALVSLLSVAAVGASLLTTQDRAYAIDDPILELTMTVVSAQPVPTGTPITWELSYQCSSLTTSCTGARIDVPLPLGQPGNIPMDPLEGSATGSADTSTAVFINSTGARFIFNDPLPAGSSGTLQFTFESDNYSTPDGTIFTPVATFTATNADPVQASAPAEVQAESRLGLAKYRGTNPLNPPLEPPLDTDVQYTIEAYIPGGGTPGTLATGNLRLTDVLPRSDTNIPATFVSAEGPYGPGTYDPATNTVTWAPGPAASGSLVDTPLNDLQNGLKFFITLRYPAASGFTVDMDTSNTSDEVTNNASITGTPWNADVSVPRPPDLTATASVTHGFDAPEPSGTFEKHPSQGNLTIVERGQFGRYDLTFTNRGNTLMEVDVTDYLPCRFVSPEVADRQICANPGFLVDDTNFQSITQGSYFQGEYGVSGIGNDYTVNYTTNLGNTGTLVLTDEDPRDSPGVDDLVGAGPLADGEFVSHFQVTTVVAPATSAAVGIVGRVAPDLPADDPALPPNREPDSLRNCAQGTFTFNGAPGFSLERCGFINVVSPFPKIGVTKRSFDSVEVPGGQIAWQVDVDNYGSAALQPVVTDLLPPELRYVPGSGDFQFYNNGGMSPAFEEPVLEVIDNYDGTGRQLLRWTFPGGAELAAGDSPGTFLRFLYATRVQPGTPQGGYRNDIQAFEARAAFTDPPPGYTFTPTRLCFNFASNYEIDTEDLDGDGNRTEQRCRNSSPFTVAQSANMTVDKAVRGIFDADFQAPPAVGFTAPGQPATYRINFTNPGNVPIENLVIYDILPYVGDTGSGGSLSAVARGSEWQPILTAPIVPPAGVTVEYSTSRNPCRGEVFTAGGATDSAPVGCVAGTFTSVAPADLSTVASLRFTYAGILTTGASSPDIFVSVEAPDGADAASGVAWNSAAISGQRADNNAFLLPTEPPRVGLAAAADLTIDKSHTAANFVRGETGTFTIVVHNNGPSTASGLTTVTDTLPTGLTFASAGGPGWACPPPAADPQVFACTTTQEVLSGADFAPITLVVNVAADAPASVTNRVIVLNVSDDDSTNNEDEDTVTILAPLPTIMVDKTATPLSRPAPGGVFTFNVVVTNTGPVPVTITALIDDIYGNIATQGTCTTAVGTLLPADPDGAGTGVGGVYSCSFTGPFTGVSGASQTDIVTATAVDAVQNVVTDSDDATVTLTPGPEIVVDKTATPLSRPEPGGTFAFNVLVTNPSPVPVTITALTDSIYGNIATQGTCTTAVGTVLAADPDGPGGTPGGSYACSFTGEFLGNAGDSETDIVTVTGIDAQQTVVTDTDDAVVTLTDVLPTVLVDKTATPAVLDEPGGIFTFNVVVTNTSPEPVTITTLTDDIYGNIATQGTCTTAVGTLLAADPDGPGPGLGGQYSCSFPGNFTGDAGDEQIDVVTVVVTDDDGSTATDIDDATVTIRDVVPAISVDKTVTPGSLPEPGGIFTYSVAVTNTGSESVTITALTDDIYGNLVTIPGSTCGALIGTTLAVGVTSPICTFPGLFTGNAGDSETDTVTATAVDNEGTPVTDTDDAEVTLTDVPPTVVVDKTATPSSLPEPGGTFTFTVVVTNTSNEPVTITTLTDDIYGNIATQGTCTTAVGTLLVADPDGPGPGLGGQYTCSFPGIFTGNAGDAQTDVVTVVVTDDDGSTATDIDDAVVTLTNVPPTVLVDKTATPSSLPEPGGTFTFTVVVTNTSNEPVTITTLTDNVYGNLATQGTCTTALGTLLAADPDGAGPLLGGQYTCSFPGVFTGNAGDTETDIVTVIVTDDDNTPATDTDDAVVTITDLPPTVLLDKTAFPASQPAPGGLFTFTVVVTNTSNEPVTITTLTDDIYGNIATQGTCTTALGTTLAADPDGAGPVLGGVYTCSFTGAFIGTNGASQTDIVTVVVTDDDDTTATDTDDATVTLTAGPPPPAPPASPLGKTGSPITDMAAIGLMLLAMGGLLAFFRRRRSDGLLTD